MLGLYLAVPFCRSKCSYCNFASEVYAPALYREYAALLASELELAAASERLQGAVIDSVYWGGGTPTLLPADSLATVMAAVRAHFTLAPDCEHTVEAAPGTLDPPRLEALAAAGVNRLSLGVQSFVDAEARAVGRLHRAATVADDLARLRAAGIDNINLDLIAGLPHQSESSWRESLAAVIDAGVPHASVYMLEVDEDSRLGSELLAGGGRYHAHFVPDDDLITQLYETACRHFQDHGLRQYEISNFGRPGRASRHNERYWLRRPYLGVGVDAHSFLPQPARRFANTANLGEYMAALRQRQLPRGDTHALLPHEEIEEVLFLGLRRNDGVALGALESRGGPVAVRWLQPRVDRLVQTGLLTLADGVIRLSAPGRLLSNSVFAEFLGIPVETHGVSASSPLT